MKSNRYWKRRVAERVAIADALALQGNKELAKVYRLANKSIQTEIDAIYRTFGAKTGIPASELKTMLSHGETKKFFNAMQGKAGADDILKRYQYRISRLERLELQVHQLAKGTHPDALRITTNTIADTAKSSYLKGIYDIEVATDTALAFEALNTRRLEQLMSSRWSGKNYSERVWANTDALAKKLSTQVTADILAGKSRARIAREVRDTFNTSLYQANRLVRTESAHYDNQVQSDIYNQFNIDEYVFMATLDSRTDIDCGSLDGHRFRVSEQQEGVNYPVMHPMCRCTTRAYLGDEFEPATRRVKGEGIVDYKNWQTWAKSTPQGRGTLSAKYVV